MQLNEISISLGAVWFILSVIGNWQLFKKAGRPGWHSLIPFVNTCEEYAICWSALPGFLFSVLLIGINIIGETLTQSTELAVPTVILVVLLFVLHWTQSQKLARAFGKGFSYGLFLFVFGRIARVVLGLSSASYVGRV